MPQDAESPSFPFRVAQYELSREIGRGGMAILYEAQHVPLGIRVAVKRALPSTAGDAVVHARFLSEARCAARIRHANVVRVLDYGVDGGVPYLAMELLQGAPLSSLLATEGPLSVRRAVDLFLPLLCGTSAVHSAGNTHRDIKPHNVFVRRVQGAEEPVVIDFGVAKCGTAGRGADEATKITVTGTIVGSAAYMAPEQILVGEDVGPAADQYALGVTLYECLTGKLPFSGAGQYEVMHAALHARPHAPREHRPEIPAGVEEVVLRAMSREAERRYPSVHAMGEALLPFASEAAALVWRADAARDGGAAAASELTAPDRAASPERPRRAAMGRSMRALLLLTTLVGGGLGAATATLLERGPQGAYARVEKSAIAAPTPATTSEPVATAGSPEWQVPATSVASPPSSTGVQPPKPKVSAETHRSSRGTNGAPILE
jgi:serine/threonine protein kinase